MDVFIPIYKNAKICSCLLAGKFLCSCLLAGNSIIATYSLHTYCCQNNKQTKLFWSQLFLQTFISRISKSSELDISIKAFSKKCWFPPLQFNLTSAWKGIRPIHFHNVKKIWWIHLTQQIKSKEYVWWLNHN